VDVWLIQLTPDSDAILGGHQALATFHDDGTVEADFSAETGDGSATAVLTSARGGWLLEASVCRISLISLVNDANQRFAGTATVDVEAQLGSDGRVLDGTFDFALVSPGGQSLGDGSGTFRGESIRLDPLH